MTETTNSTTLDLNNLYGDAVETTNNPSWTGEVAGYRMTNFFINDKNSLELNFTKEQPQFDTQRPLRGWVNAVDMEKVNVWEGKTRQECIKNEVNKQNKLIKNLICNYVTPEEYTAHLKGFVSTGSLQDRFIQFVNHVAQLLPDNYAEVEGRLVVGYKANGYLAFPTRMGWDGDARRHRPFFSVDPETQLMAMPKNLTPNKPTPEAELGEDDVDDDF